MDRIKIKSRSAKNIKVILPVDGIVSLDADGIVEVSAKAAEALVGHNPDWSIAEPIKTPAPNAGGKEDEEEDETEGEEDERAKYEAWVNASPLKELVSYAEDAELPAEEIKAAKKTTALMRAYLISKFDELFSEEEAEEPIGAEPNEGGERSCRR